MTHPAHAIDADAAELIPRPDDLRGPQPELPPTLRWEGGIDGALLLLDQTLLPGRVMYRRCTSVGQVWTAIRELCVRGAPAIGVAAAYGLSLDLRGARTPQALREFVAQSAIRLISARPTAVNLEWAVRRVLGRVQSAPDRNVVDLREAILNEAHAIYAAEAAACRQIGEQGARLISDGVGVLTHCNAGALATVAWGTALAPLYVAREQGRSFRVFADETRPLLQGSRLTAFELATAGMDVTVLCDGAAASLMRSGQVSLVITGADRIAANGDTANKVGTYGLALAAHAHGIPFYVAAPLSTFDRSLQSGAAIPIEHRAQTEVWSVVNGGSGSLGARAWNPAFDVTPADIIRGILTERGVVEPVTAGNIEKIFAEGSCKGG